MVGIGALATGAAPILGGVLLAMAGGQLMGGTNFRGGIKDDLELLALLPEDQVTQREALRASIVDRVDELLVADEKRRNLRAAAVRRRLKPCDTRATLSPAARRAHTAAATAPAVDHEIGPCVRCTDVSTSATAAVAVVNSAHACPCLADSSRKWAVVTRKPPDTKIPSIPILL